MQTTQATNIGEHVLCGYLVSIIYVFETIENRHNLYRGEDCIKKICSSLREHAANATKFERKKMLL